MSPQDAIHHVVHDFPGGAEALAPRVGRGAQVLRNKVSQSHDAATRRSHEPTLADVSAITRVTGDLRVLDALAAEVGAVVLRLPTIDALGDSALLDMVLTANDEYGQACAALRDALADGEVDRLEFDRLERETLESVRAQLELLDRVRGMLVERPRLRAVKGRR